MSAFDGTGILKKMPFSMEAEQAILGSILLDSSKLSDVMVQLKPEHFYLEQNKAIYYAMTEMFLVSKEIDVVTLIDTLTSLGNYTEGDAAKYIKLLADLSTVASNLPEYITIIKDKALLRMLIDASGAISEEAFAEIGSAGDILDLAEQKIFEIGQNRYNIHFEHIKDVILRNYENLNELKSNPDAFLGIKTEFSGLDRFLVGMGGGDLIVLGGRPGMGKTSFALNIAVNVAKSTKKEVAIFSLEMSSEQLVSRILSSEALIDNYSMRTGNLTTDQWKKLAEKASVLSETNILIDDTSSINTTSMKAKLRRLKSLGLVVIDYLQLMQGDKYVDNRVLEIGQITRALKLMAKDLNVPVILCSQLARKAETHSDKMPLLSDLRDSGTIEQDADIVMFLFREDYYKKAEGITEHTDGPGFVTAQCNIAKNRHGSTAKVPLAWYGQYFKFITVDRRDDE